MKTTAVIPVRKGSQRVPRKNLRPFAGSSLLELKIRTLLPIPEIDEVVVNTDSEEAIELVNKLMSDSTLSFAHKLKYHRREPYFASSNCPGSTYFQHLGEVTDTDIFVYAPCTSPFIKAETIRRCIQQYHNTPCDSVSTVSEVKEFLWWNSKPVNYDPTHAPNSQDLPQVQALNFGCSVVSRTDLISRGNIVGVHPLFIPTDDVESIDIDTPLDFFLAEQVYRRVILEQGSLLD